MQITSSIHDFKMNELRILVKTGFMKGAGTNSDINVIVEDIHGKHLHKRKNIILVKDGLYIMHVKVEDGFDRVDKLRLERHRNLHDDAWYCDYIIVQDPRGSKNNNHRKITNAHSPGIISDEFNGHYAEYYFPVHRWVLRNHSYIFGNSGICLPKDDLNIEARRADIENKRNYYKLREVSENLAILVSINVSP